MVKKRKISGVKRRTVAVESTYRFFQTIDLIISHLKREADKKMIYQLIKEKPTLNSLLVATAAVDLYNYRGIRVKSKIEENKFSDLSALENEVIEKEILIKEIELTLKDSFKFEIDLLKKIIEIENIFISLLIQEEEVRYQDSQKSKDISELEQNIEQELLNIILNYPPFYFYDFIGDLIGLTEEIRMEILKESAGLKEVFVNVETRLQTEEKEDKFLELSTLSRLINKIQRDFEFKSYKEIQTQTMSLRMIKRKIFDYELNKYPTSLYGLKVFREANLYKKHILSLIEVALDKEESYDNFEFNVLQDLKDELISRFKNHPNDLIYFLQCLNDSRFEDIIFLINRRGIIDTLHLLNVNQELLDQIRKTMIRYNIKKEDLVLLNDPKRNPIILAKKFLCNLKKPYLDIIKDSINLPRSDLFAFINRDDPRFQEIWTIFEKELKISINDLREIIRKKQIIEKIFFIDLNLKNYLQIITLIDFEEILSKITIDIFYYILSRITRQLSRIIELYAKISNDKSIFYTALKGINFDEAIKDWAFIKLEELCINRLIRRQNELVIVLNANNQVFLVNGFILSRLTEGSVKESIEKLQNDVSHIYKEAAPLSLKADLVSPVSYCLAYDLIKRFETLKEKEIQETKTLQKVQKEIDEERRIERKERKEKNTLNWIERKITSTLIGISRPGINPKHFYWQERDTKSAAEQIKIHSELEGGIFNRVCEFYEFCVEKIRSFHLDIELPDSLIIKKEVTEIFSSILKERLGSSINQTDFEKILDGEKYQVGKEIAKNIGSLLDNALYTKFKQQRRNIKS